MELSEIKKLKIEAETEVLEVIRKFEETSGIVVDSMDTAYESLIGVKKPKIRDVILNITI